ncbi:superoxide dismutase [Cu-Zn] SodC2 [Pusillimonas sp. TS35]|uniref:superoxide dismutase family protein n=1 Tax=Paracandidimonas lactea TaxID=2895524 RepID=UPI00136F53C7|nr:superoxide dismutase family protein [Paracandidimonas lactea]MYN14781.1 superoxide dismutase [Cu-Zn] SodC2 [Pusillimonas sp. TS35]
MLSIYNKGARLAFAIVWGAAGWVGAAHAEVTVPMAMATDKGPGKEVGQVVVTPSPYGLVFTPALSGLKPGLHGFHVHENPSCNPSEKEGKTTHAGAAGGHLDPDKRGKHGAPWGEGHLGDLPALYVDADGKAEHPVLAPRLTKLEQLAGRSLMIHEGGDNYADAPKPLGGGGGRMACGVVRGSK